MAELLVDTRGLSCPEPVLRTKEAAARTPGPFDVLVDNGTALGNVQRFLKSARRAFEVAENGEEYVIHVQ